ncbi:MAG: Flp pilus assembly protein CpaB, partial [Acidimicrobiia bacterium]|nr:Flp pilus assembly protein CpaB [Acidimicrobiia bacterium]
MSKRVIGLLAAVVLALVGTVALVAFVSGAEDRALEGEELVEVYVVTDLIPGGTAGDDLEDSVIVEEVPAKVRPDDAVDNLAALRGRVAAVDLQPGEQLLESRFVGLDEFADRAVGVQIPDDMVEITVALDPERAVGGLLEPGQTVAVIASFEPFQLSATVVEIDGQEVALPAAVADSVEGATPNTTDIILRKVLVTAVQQQENSSLGNGEDGSSRLNTAPDGSLLVTLAVPPYDAERVVFTAEFGTLWLAVEREDVPEIEDSIKTRGNVYDENDNE